MGVTLNRFNRIYHQFVHCVILALALTAGGLAYGQQTPDDNLTPLFASLSQARLSKVAAILEEIERVGGDTVLPLFETMLNGDLYYYEDQPQRLVKAVRNADRDYDIYDIFSGEALGTESRQSIDKIKVNNRLRRQLRQAISRINLNSSDATVRLKAVNNMFGGVDEDTVSLLEDRQKIENDKAVLNALFQTLALFRLQHSDDDQERIAAIEILSGHLDPMVRNELTSLLEKEDGQYIEQNPELIAAAEKSLREIKSRLSIFRGIEQLFFGLSMGSVFLLAAIGLAITFGVMGVINMAHGEMMMLGAYTAYVVQQVLPNYIEYSILIAIPASFLVAGLVGVAIERGIIQFLKGRPLETLLATFGVSLILQQAVRSIFSPLNRQVVTPEWLSGSLEINSALSITYNRLYILLFALLVFAAVQLVMKYTSLGLNVRAVSQNRSMAKAMGIKTEWVDAMTFGLGSGIAGVAGVALSQLTNVGPNLGQAYIIDSFMVVVFGGVGNLLGTVVGGFTLGIANKFLEPATGAVMAKILILIFIILFIQRRPKGLFPQKGRAAND